jgi:hypothetical protein
LIILFVNSEKIGSKIIQYGTDEVISHVAVQFEHCEFVYHAYGSKIHEDSFHDFHAKYNLIDFVKIDMSPSDEEKVRVSLANSIWYEAYDKKAFLYFAWDLFKVKFFGKKQATRNPLNSNDDSICTEVINLVEDFYQEVTGKYLLPDNIDLSITTPGQFCSILKSRFPQ